MDRSFNGACRKQPARDGSGRRGPVGLPGVEFYRDLLDDLSDGVYFLDPDGRIVYWNRGAERITGYTAEEVLGKRCAEHLLVHSDCEGRILCGSESCPAALAVARGTVHCGRIFIKHKRGHRIPVITRVRPLVGSDGAVVGAAEVFHVESSAFAAGTQIEALKRAALLDPLTGVGNRRLGEMELETRLEESTRYGWGLGVLFADIDHFKRVNDVHGHDVGDRFLKMVAQTLSHNVRSFDVVSRWGGDELLLLLKNIRPDDLLTVGSNLLGLVRSASLTVGSFQLRATLSIGATMARPGETPEVLMRRVDELMYRSKQEGRDRISSDSAIPRREAPLDLAR